MSTQPEALRLANDLEIDYHGDVVAHEAAAELRRLHDEVESLRQAYNIVTDDCRNLTEKVIPNIRAQRDALLDALEEIHQATMKNKVVIAKYIGINFLAAIAIRKAKEGE